MALALRVAQRFNLGVGFAGSPMPALADHPAAFDQDGTHHRVGRGSAIAAPRQAHCQAHPFEVRVLSRVHSDFRAYDR
jgi:hypothetical protein